MRVFEDGESNESSFEVIGVCDKWLECRAHNLFNQKLGVSTQSAAGQLRQSLD